MDYTEDGQTLLVGAVGSLAWRGSVVSIDSVNTMKMSDVTTWYPTGEEDESYIGKIGPIRGIGLSPRLGYLRWLPIGDHHSPDWVPIILPTGIKGCRQFGCCCHPVVPDWVPIILPTGIKGCYKQSGCCCHPGFARLGTHHFPNWDKRVFQLGLACSIGIYSLGVAVTKAFAA